jgi:hypothetical protein
MKKILFVILLVSSGFLLQKADAQMRVNINVGTQPDWGPYGYDYAQFYYFPDIDVYYDVVNQQYVYFDGYEWRSSPYMPSAYNNFDLYGAYKVVINEPRPYLRADYYRKQYYGYRGYHSQPVLRDYRNGGFNNRREEGFEQRGERFEQRDQRFENHSQPERNDRGSYEQRNNSNSNGYEQRNSNNNRNLTQQRNNNNNSNEQVNGNNRFGSTQKNDNRGERSSEHDRYGSGQRNDNRSFGARH